MSIKEIARLSIVAAIYVALTMAVSPIAFGPIQFRISEILLLLCFFNPKYGFSLVIGCFLANLFSPYGWIDWVFGTGQTLITVLLIIWAARQKMPLWAASLAATITTPLIGIGIYLATSGARETFWFVTGYVAIGEFVVVSIVGVTLFKLISKNFVRNSTTTTN